MASFRGALPSATSGFRAGFKAAVLGSAALALASVVGASEALATAITIVPSAVVSGADGAQTFDNATVSDYAIINVAANGSFTESGLIQLSALKLGGSTDNTPGLNQTYALYLQFSATGTQSSATVIPAVNASVTGVFNTLDFTLYAAAGKPTFGATAGGAAVTGTSNAIAVATGSLISGTATLTNTAAAGLSAGANALTTFNEINAPFFGGTISSLSLDFFTSVTNTGSVLSTNGTSELIIDGGGGNATVTQAPVPEPFTLSLLGTGLIGLALVRRRKSRV